LVLFFKKEPLLFCHDRTMQNPSLNLSYGPDARHKLDLFPAASAAPGRLVMHVHGGGWNTGGKGAGAKLARVLGPAGYAVAAMTYRLVPHTDVAGIMSDVAEAAAFLMRGAAGFGLETRRFAVQGHSAGGHLAALLGADPSYLEAAGLDPARLAGVLALDGVFDIAADLTQFPGKIAPEIFGADRADWARFSPTARLRAGRALPLFGILHEDSRQRFVVQARKMADALRDCGAAFELGVAPGLSHVDMMRLYEDAAQPMRPFSLSFYARAFGGA
jgi:acetyl esterase/lipase